ncbi:hypothetical protein FN846DRAFT_894447 [Sphaerosporella brunnea]|uniref:Uncharacterized protein n=1 Tax=Sphaerosporella brunnea TaxID=1250544 RepID=A0A5J5EHE4_9PEZI|nr:hypothetical protein FN846DRAFT_894447 [Sphaerosporella brunnea]
MNLHFALIGFLYGSDSRRTCENVCNPAVLEVEDSGGLNSPQRREPREANQAGSVLDDFLSIRMPVFETRRARYSDRTDLVAQGDLGYVIHGYWSPGGSPATLVIAEFRFVGSDSSRHFRSATITFTFTPRAAKNRGCPEVISISPFGHFSPNVTQLSEEGQKSPHRLEVACKLALDGSS